MLLLNIYRYFQRRRWVLALLVVFVFAVTAWFAAKMQLEEDINKFIPKDKSVDEINFVLQNLKIRDKLVITISNTNSEAGTDDMMASADAFADSLSAPAYQHLIKDFTYKVSDDLMQQVYGTFYEHLPIFLEEKDYLKINGLLQPDSIRETLKNDYKTLLSPSGFALGKFIRQDPLSLTALALKKMQSIQFDENFEVNEGYIMTKDHQHLMLFITPSFVSNDNAQSKQLIGVLDRVVAPIQKQLDNKVTIEYYGAAAVALGNSVQVRDDSLYTSIIALICIVILLTVFFRRVLAVFYILLPVAFGALFSLTLLYFLKHEISAIALGAGSIVLGIAINYSLHFFTHFKHEQSVEKVIKDLSLPMLIGCTTTVGAFLSLQFAKSQALHDFGLFAAFSLIGAMLFSIIVIPHLLKKSKNQPTKTNVHPDKPSLIDRIITYRYDKSKVIVITVFLLTIVFAITSQYVQFESDMLKMNYQNDKLAQAQQHLDEINNFSLSSVYVVSKGKNLNEALKNNEHVTEKLAELQQNKLISKYSSVSTLLISDSLQQERIKRWNTFWTKEKKDSLEKRLVDYGSEYKFKPDAFSGFYSQLTTDFQPVQLADLDTLKKLIVNDWITENDSITTVVSVVKVEPESKQFVYDAFKNNTATVVFDKQFMSSRFVEIISSDFNLILIITGILVFGFMLLSHGRIELAIINFLPMFISWLWILGIMGLLGLKFNIINIIISTFIFGLGDDYSIFIMDGLSKEYKYGRKNLDSYKTSILLSVLTTVIGIGVLIFAKHPALQSIAAITIIGMITVLIISFVVQPLCYNFLILNRKKRGLLPYTALNLFLTLLGFLFFIAGSLILTVSGLLLLYVVPAPVKKKKLVYHYMIMYTCKFMIYMFVNVKKKIINTQNDTLNKPAIIICNHQSHIDLALTLMLHPKVIVFTNDWVWNSVFYGRIVKMADFYPASQGYEAAIDKVRALMADGYSVLIFPEGTRSTTGNILRFHKGAFYLAEILKADILPLLLHGAGDCVTKGDFHFKEGSLTVKYLARIKYDDPSYGSGYKERSKNACAMMRTEYELLRKEQETVEYFRPRLIKNYIFKGPVLEWYCRIKVGLEDNYRLFESYLPKGGKITDVGCGYGFLPLMLSFTGSQREIIGIDYDEEKINIASGCTSKTERVKFVCADVTDYQYENSDAFIISDVLHYLKEEQQVEVISRCINKLNSNGVMIIRDADADKKQRHWGTRYTEFFSTNSGFNKTKEDGLHFASASLIKATLDKFPFVGYEVIDNTKLTSNIIFIIRHNGKS
ncbi:MAG: 1-acyl-sn-glycerol-3-phosphate acyltransferase [Bacteroidia bacterium]